MIRGALILPDSPNRAALAKLLSAELKTEVKVSSPLSADQPAPEWIGEIEAIFSFGIFLNDAVFAAAHSLRWLQSVGSGTDGLADRPGLDPRVVVTSAHGIHQACVSEAAIALMLAMARDIPRLVLNQRERRWQAWPSHLLENKTVGILGVGMIAAGLAARCAAFGMTVEGVSGRADAPGFARMHRYDELEQAVARFDHLVLLAPLSERTRHIINARVLAAMKPEAFLINVARGGLVDENALIAALEAGHLAGAALDVFEVEPLPANSRLWSLPNVLISPHAGGNHRDYRHHLMPIVRENIAAYRAGNYDAMINRVPRAV